MKNLFSYISTFIFCTLILGACKTNKLATATSKDTKAPQKKWTLPTTTPIAAKTDDNKSLLWEISGNGLAQPSYLFGTIHLIEKRNFFLSDLAKDRFDRTEQLTLEIDMDDASMLMKAMGGMMMEDGKTLKDLYSEEDYKMVSSYFVDSLGMSLFMLEGMKPILLSSMMMEQGEEEMISYEAAFMELAGDKEILGLETAEYQMSMLDSIPYDVQADMLLDMIKNQGNEEEDLYLKMVNLYKEQDIDALYEVTISADAQMEEYQGPLLITRNKNWIPVMDKMSRQMPTFFAVGAAHLSGEYGVISLLKKAGFTLTPLKPIEK